MLCTLMIFIALSGGISAWTPATTNRLTPFITSLPSRPNPDNPCYDSDDDCLSTAYSASFIPAEWIRSMDCGKDVDCLPEKLSRPGTRGSGVEKVDVMEYLNIRNAVTIGEKSS